MIQPIIVQETIIIKKKTLPSKLQVHVHLRKHAYAKAKQKIDLKSMYKYKQISHKAKESPSYKRTFNTHVQCIIICILQVQQ